MSSDGLTVYGPEVGMSGLSASLDDFIRRETGLEIARRFFSIHSRASIASFYSLTGSTGGKHWRLVLDLFDMRPACATIWSGPNALERLQKLKGNTQPARAPRDTVRGRFFCDNPVTNLIHVSDDKEIMEAELKILRQQMAGDVDTGWLAAASGRISHSSFRVLLDVLGDDRSASASDGEKDGDALEHARFCYRRAYLLAKKTDTPAIQDYFRGEAGGLEALLRRGPVLSAWDRLILEAGLFSMPLWSALLDSDSPPEAAQ
ncbi:nucleoside-diphosphate kinase [Neorhizobium lilium]|uniref:Nucleoside-diphosphate kinase n=1 Tax=Neorhizobium lilium TaxID=2503024 RepID=A0A444LB98_9HYPH|nr:nucleoside-diphosphate kinase [Neorhizobium lilium]RWX74839.1 nucleoside-diphosphate kinase [Neorhizobium lilium]